MYAGGRNRRLVRGFFLRLHRRGSFGFRRGLRLSDRLGDRRWRRLRLRFEILRSLFDGGRVSGSVAARASAQSSAHFERDVVVERTRVGLLIGHAQLGQQLEDHVRLNLQLASKLIYTDFTHTVRTQRRLSMDTSSADRVKRINLS